MDRLTDRPIDLEGDFVRVGDDLVVPSRFPWSRPSPDPSEGTVRMEIAVDRWGRPSCRCLEVTPNEGASVSGEMLRRIPIARLLTVAMAEKALHREEAGGIHVIGPAGDRELDGLAELQPRRPRRGSPMTDEHLARVSKVYRGEMARNTGRPTPRRAIATEFHVSESTAANWIAQARKRGYLQPAVKGRAGG